MLHPGWNASLLQQLDAVDDHSVARLVLVQQQAHALFENVDVPIHVTADGPAQTERQEFIVGIRTFSVVGSCDDGKKELFCFGVCWYLGVS